MYLNQLPESLAQQAVKQLNFVELPPPKQVWQTKTLIFDLDETLAHCLDTEDGHTSLYTKQFSNKPHYKVNITCSNGTGGQETIEAGVNLRPHLRECLA